MIEKLNIECKSCKSDCLYLVYDFGAIPHVNKYYSLTKKFHEKKYPLRLAICSSCFLLQLLDEIDINDMFIEYHHMSSASHTNKEYLNSLSEKIFRDYKNKKILEVGSNDLTMVNFLLNKGMDIYGVEPAKNLFKENGRIYNGFLNSENIDDIKDRFGEFDLIFGINVFAHNPEFIDLFHACNSLLKNDGTLHIEVAYALRTICDGNYDTIYHEHFCSYTLISIENVLNLAGFKIIDAMEIDTQGGSLQITAKKLSYPADDTTDSYKKILSKELEIGINTIDFYERVSSKISSKAENIKKYFDSNRDNIVFIGAPARGVVTLNTANIAFGDNVKVIDDTPEKLGLCFPGYNFIIDSWDIEIINKFEKVFILSWNYKDYLVKRLNDSGYEGEIVLPFPNLEKV